MTEDFTPPSTRTRTTGRPSRLADGRARPPAGGRRRRLGPHGAGNRRLQLGLYIKQRPDQLPFLWQWKQLTQGTYVAGLEPANCFGRGRADDRERGTLKFLEPGQKQTYNLEVGVLDLRRSHRRPRAARRSLEIRIQFAHAHAAADEVRRVHGAVPRSVETRPRARARPGADRVARPAGLRRGLGRRAPQRRLGDHRFARDVPGGGRRAHPHTSSSGPAWSACRTTTR